jgi:hypothetical protein
LVTWEIRVRPFVLRCLVNTTEMEIGLLVFFGLAILTGTFTHFRILRTLEAAQISTPYFANVSDFVRAYRTYLRLAPNKGWPEWPLYFTFGAYAGLLGLALLLLIAFAVGQHRKMEWPGRTLIGG